MLFKKNISSMLVEHLKTNENYTNQINKYILR